MRKAFRIIYLLIMPILFVALLAICLSFDGTMQLTTTAENVDGAFQINVNADCLVNMTGTIFNISNWKAALAKTFKYTFDPLTFSLTLKDISGADALALGKDATVTLQMLSIIGIVVFGIGFFLSEVGYGSKVATVIGALILIAGSVCIFVDGHLDDGLHYIMNVISTQNGEQVTQNVLNVNWNWLSIKLVAGIADGLTLINVLFVLIRRRKAI